MHFAGSNLSTDPKCPKCIYKISKNFRVEKSGEISRNLRFSRFFVPASKSDTHHGWGGRIRTDECQSQSLVPYRLATPQCLIHLFIIPYSDASVKVCGRFLFDSWNLCMVVCVWFYILSKRQIAGTENTPRSFSARRYRCIIKAILCNSRRLPDRRPLAIDGENIPSFGVLASAFWTISLESSKIREAVRL